MNINITPMVDFKCVKDGHDIGLYVKEKIYYFRIRARFVRLLLCVTDENIFIHLEIIEDVRTDPR